MVKVEEGQEAKGIKLFGKTIVFQVKEEATHEDKSGDQMSLEKRPDKIIPCPRCKSMETKFCYFNNYNVNQPRHFCKGCQRYWTAGGVLRNVPVGAGRRKAKLPGRPSLPDAFPENCVFDPSRAYQVDYFVDRVALEGYWAHRQQAVATTRGDGSGGGCGGFNPNFPAKRRKNVSYGQSNC